jgi:integrase
MCRKRRKEADTLLEGADAPHVRLFIVLALYTAARAGALLSLTWQQVDLERDLIHAGAWAWQETLGNRTNTPDLREEAQGSDRDCYLPIGY